MLEIKKHYFLKRLYRREEQSVSCLMGSDYYLRFARSETTQNYHWANNKQNTYIFASYKNEYIIYCHLQLNGMDTATDIVWYHFGV